MSPETRRILGFMGLLPDIEVVRESATGLKESLAVPGLGRAVAAYFDPAEGFAGMTFTSLGSNPRDEVTAEDLLAVALLDGQVTPAQYEPERILRPDVQSLLRKIRIHPDAGFSARFPREMPARVSIALRDGGGVDGEVVLEREVSALEPPGWSQARQKLELLAGGYTSAEQRTAIAETIAKLERIQVSELTKVLAEVSRPSVRPRAA